MNLRVYWGNANPELGRNIVERLGISPGRMDVTRFSDGEIQVKIEESTRGADVFLVQPTCSPVNEHIMELLIMIDAFRRASARRITVVLPYYGYARQDKKIKPREPITAKLVANMIHLAGARRVLAVDLHSEQIQGFFDVPVDHLPAAPIIAQHFIERELCGEDVVVVSPDVGGVARASILANMLKSPLAIIAKKRPKPNQAQVMEIIGQVEGKTAILFDDMIDTAGSVVAGAEALLARGTKEIYASCTHAIFSGPAVERLENSPIREIIVTDTIPQSGHKTPKLTVLSVAALLAEAIERIHLDISVSKLFER